MKLYLLASFSCGVGARVPPRALRAATIVYRPTCSNRAIQYIATRRDATPHVAHERDAVRVRRRCGAPRRNRCPFCLLLAAPSGRAPCSGVAISSVHRQMVLGLRSLVARITNQSSSAAAAPAPATVVTAIIQIRCKTKGLQDGIITELRTDRRQATTFRARHSLFLRSARYDRGVMCIYVCILYAQSR